MKWDDPSAGEKLKSMARATLHAVQHNNLDYEYRENYGNIPVGYWTRLECCKELNIPLRRLVFYTYEKKIPFIKIGKKVFFEPFATVEAFKKIDKTRGRKPK